VRQRLGACVALLILGVVCVAAQQAGANKGAATDFTGTWVGTWDGTGAGGGFDLTLDKTKDGAPGGQVSVTGEPTYKATLKTLAFEGKAMSATYDFPPDDRAEVALTATFEGDTAKGTWTLRGKGDTGQVANGTFTVKKK
jgi:hypothetical protein